MLLPLALASCAPFGTSKTERVMRLENDLNESRQYAYQNFDPATTLDYTDLATLPPSQTWDDWFPPAEMSDTTKYVLEVQDTSPDSASVRVTGPVDFAGPRTLTVGLVRIGLEWYINRLDLSGYLPSPLIVQ
ncbi:MAG: hypothetical protein A2V99_06885 [Spirochaetes bacterium RBG_16_67_19]|nr:MAG: hypothetical protein A2V99_06885 [Spirochaetes bacterium RBG_16_67_19]